MSPRPSFPPPAPKPGKHRLFIGIMLAVVLLGGIGSFMMSGGKKVKSVAKRDDIIIVTPLPKPPPPPPPLKPEPPPPPDKPPESEEMVEQEQVPDDEPPPDNSPPDSPPSDLGSNTSGSGPSIGGGTGGNGKIGTGRKGGGSKWGYYAAKVQTTIKDALSRNASTRSATFSLQVRVWADSNGRITRAQLVGSSGNPAVDQSIKNQVLTGLQLPEPPPAGMPMPITMRISARKS